MSPTTYFMLQKRVKHYYRVFDAYSHSYRRLPSTPIYWNIKTRRASVATPRQLVGCAFSSLIPAGLCSTIPKLLQLFYLLLKYAHLGHFPTGDEFGSPLQLLSIAIISFATGGSFIITVFAYILRFPLARFVNEFLSIQQQLLDRSTYQILKQSHKNVTELFLLFSEIVPKKRKRPPKPDWLAELVATALCRTPGYLLCMNPIMVLFAMYNGLDPIYFFVKGILRQPYSGLSPLLRNFVSLLSFSCCTWSMLYDCQVLLGLGYTFILASWTFLQDIELIRLDYKRRGEAFPSSLR